MLDRNKIHERLSHYFKYIDAVIQTRHHHAVYDGKELKLSKIIEFISPEIKKGWGFDDKTIEDDVTRAFEFYFKDSDIK